MPYRRWTLEEEELVILAAGDEEALVCVAGRIRRTVNAVRARLVRLKFLRGREGQRVGFDRPACISAEEFERTVQGIERDSLDRLDALVETRRLAVLYAEEKAREQAGIPQPAMPPPPPSLRLRSG